MCKGGRESLLVWILTKEQKNLKELIYYALIIITNAKWKELKNLSIVNFNSKNCYHITILYLENDHREVFFYFQLGRFSMRMKGCRYWEKLGENASERVYWLKWTKMNFLLEQLAFNQLSLIFCCLGGDESVELMKVLTDAATPWPRKINKQSVIIKIARWNWLGFQYM